MGDLTSLVDGLAAENLDDESLKNLILGLHPVIAQLIEASMPHIHANEGPNSGFLFPVFENEGKQVGTVEIKLYDDAEATWKSGLRKEVSEVPWRLSIDSALTLAFPALEKRLRFQSEIAKEMRMNPAHPPFWRGRPITSSSQVLAKRTHPG